MSIQTFPVRESFTTFIRIWLGISMYYFMYIQDYFLREQFPTNITRIRFPYPVCVFTCLSNNVSLFLSINNFPQIPQVTFFSPCIFLCINKRDDPVKDLSQTLQAYGQSSECVHLICVLLQMLFHKFHRKWSSVGKSMSS